MRYFIHLSYLGTNYSGWQRQTNAVSVQQMIEDALSKILKEKVLIHGCGRTDAGVHARQYFAHVDIKQALNFDLVVRLNLVLPHDISIYNLIQVDAENHAQYDAIKRSYVYHLHTKKMPLKTYTSAYYNVNQLNISKIKEAVHILKNTIDFRSLCKNPDLYKHTKCSIQHIEFNEHTDHEYSLMITADRFLRGMIRYIIARLIDIGTEKLTIEEFSTTLANRENFHFKFSKQGFPQGLYLYKIQYPYLRLKVV